MTTPWRKTKCCGTCARFPGEKVKDAAGRVHTERAGRCQWQSVEVYPSAVPINSWSNHRPTPNFVRVLDGSDCPCYTPGVEAK